MTSFIDNKATVAVEENNQACLEASWQALLPSACDWCPRRCGANRAAGEKGFCGADDTMRVARAALHFWEEPPLSGKTGSGAVFFSGCPLRCCFCQNAVIAADQVGKEISPGRLEEIFFELRDQGALNINLVTPTHYAPLIAYVAAHARARGFDLPFVWNTSGYETVEALHAIAPVADVFLADFKYAHSELARTFSYAVDYPEVALDALDAMVEITGEPQFDEYHGQFRMTRGVVVRHLLLPGHVPESCAAVELLYKRYGEKVLLSLMNQYTPVLDVSSAAAQKYPELLRAPSSKEYEQLLDFADSLGIEDYFWQEGGAIDESFIPAFDFTGV